MKVAFFRWSSGLAFVLLLCPLKSFVWSTSVHSYGPNEYLTIKNGLSPNGRYSIATHGSGEFGYDNFHVYLMDGRSGRKIGPLEEIIDTLDTGADAFDAQWSNDSQEVAIFYRVERHVAVKIRYRIDKGRASRIKGPVRVDRLPGRADWTGEWSEHEMETVEGILQAVAESELKNWITGYVQLERFRRDDFGPITANGSTLRFKNGFFSNNLTGAKRENLLAFEAGKVFWNTMRHKRVKAGGTLEQWFIGYSSRHSSIIADMKTAAHKNVGLSELGDIDTASQFAYVFRARALQLNKASDRLDFDEHVNPLLRDDQ